MSILGNNGLLTVKTSGADCSKALFPFQRCCGCREHPVVGAARERQVHRVPRLHPPLLPESFAALYMWKGPPDSAGNPLHKELPRREKIFLSQTHRLWRQFYVREHRRQYFLDYVPAPPGFLFLLVYLYILSCQAPSLSIEVIGSTRKIILIQYDLL